MKYWQDKYWILTFMRIPCDWILKLYFIIKDAHDYCFAITKCVICLVFEAYSRLSKTTESPLHNSKRLYLHTYKGFSSFVWPAGIDKIQLAIIQMTFDHSKLEHSNSPLYIDVCLAATDMMYSIRNVGLYNYYQKKLGTEDVIHESPGMGKCTLKTHPYGNTH